MAIDEPQSLLVILSDDAALGSRVEQLLVGFDWRCHREAELRDALDRLAGGLPAAILIDGSHPDDAQLVRELRQLPAPANGTPVLVLGEEIDLGSPGGSIPRPLDDDALIALLRHWAGPLDDHMLRADPLNPRYRLIRLLGLENAGAMLDRFSASLKEAVALADSDPAAISPHRLAGLAGMIGFAELSAVWSRVERGESTLAEAMLATCETLGELKRHPDSAVRQ